MLSRDMEDVYNINLNQTFRDEIYNGWDFFFKLDGINKSLDSA